MKVYIYIYNLYEVLASYLGCMCLLLIYFQTMLTETCFRFVYIYTKKSTYTVTIKYSLCPTMYKTTVWNFPNKRLSNMILHWAWESRKLLRILCIWKLLLGMEGDNQLTLCIHFKRMLTIILYHRKYLN